MGKSHQRPLRGGIGNHVDAYDDEEDNGDKWGVAAAAAVAEPEQPRPKARNVRVAREVAAELHNHSADETLTDIPVGKSVFVNPVTARTEMRISTIAWFVVAAIVLLPIVLGVASRSDTLLYSGLAVFGLTLTAGKLLHGAIVKAMSFGLRLRLWVTCGLTLAAVVILIAAQVGTPVWGVMVTFCLAYSLLKHMVNDVDAGTAAYSVVQVREEIVEE